MRCSLASARITLDFDENPLAKIIVYPHILCTAIGTLPQHIDVFNCPLLPMVSVLHTCYTPAIREATDRKEESLDGC